LLRGENNPAKRPEVREKLRLGKLGDLNPAKRPEVRKKISEKRRGVPNPKLSQALKGRPTWNKGKKTGIRTLGCFPKGLIPWNKGKTKESDPRVANHARRMREGAHWVYKGGQPWNKGIGYKKGYGADWTESFKERIRNRDGRRCRKCARPEEQCTRGLNVHHLDGDKRNNDPANFISLCPWCHALVTNEKTKEVYAACSA